MRLFEPEVQSPASALLVFLIPKGLWARPELVGYEKKTKKSRK